MKTILIIEDDTVLLSIYHDVLATDEWIVVNAQTGKEGLDKARESKPDLILLDIMLPDGMNGFDVLENLKREDELKNIPVIILTNLDSEKDTALKVGAVDYIIKANTSLEEVKAKVTKILGN